MLLRLGLVMGVLLVVGAVRLASAGAMCGSEACSDDPKAAQVASATTKPAATQPAAFVCPHHPDVTSDKPGKCSKCGMTLEAPKKAADHDHTH